MGEHLSPNHTLFKAFTASLPAKLSLRRQAGGCRRWKCCIEHRLWAQRTPVRRFDPSVPVEWLKIAPVQFAICANLSTSAIYRRCAGDQQIVERCQFQPQASQPLDIRNYCCIRMFSAWKRNTFTANICYFIMTEFDYAKQHMKVLCHNCLNL